MMFPYPYRTRRTGLCASISMLALLMSAEMTAAQPVDIGSVDVQGKAAPTNGLPVSSVGAVGSKAPAGSAPALAPSQSSLETIEPVSIISDKVLRDVIPPSSDYNETAKYTPGFNSSNPNGLIGDSKSGWRGFQDGQFNITFDGIPFGDANDPTHHSGAYFPGALLGGVTIDRGPGPASQVGYATFGGTMALRSIDLSDVYGGRLQTSFGSFNTMASSATIQTGKIGDTGVRGVFQYYNGFTSGALQYGNADQNQFLGKVEKKYDNFTVTVFANLGLQNYNNVTSITYPQLQAFGKTYGAVNGDPRTQQYVGYNNSQKQTDMEYIDVDGRVGDWHFSNKLYTYSYWYPNLQNNGADQSIMGAASTANGGTIASVSIPTVTGGKIKTAIVGVANGDVTGYVKYNNYRAYGDIFKMDRNFDLGYFSGTLRTGVWVERVDNNRLQQYFDYTTLKTYTQLGNSRQASFKLDLVSHITNVQPFIEYEFQPIQGLSITPGIKYESFTREHDAVVNQTTLAPLNYTATYAAALPFLSIRYRLTPEVTVYAQASKGILAPTVSAFYVFNPQNGSISSQTTTNYQAGAVYKSDRFTADFDAYQITANNFPVTNTLSTGETIWTNGGTARYRGLEAEGSYSIRNGLSIYASGALIQAKFTAGQFAGQRVGDAPSYTGAGGLIYDDGVYFGSLLQKFVGDAYGSSGQRAASPATNAALNQIKPYNTTDLVIGIRSGAVHDFGLGRSAEFRIGIYNMFDHKNTVSISGDPTGLTSINNTKLLYSFLPGRTIFASLAVDF